MLRDIINQLDMVEIDSANKKYEITKILKKYDGKVVYIKDVDGYEVVGNLYNRETIGKIMSIHPKNIMKHMLKSMENEKNGKIIVDNNLKKDYVKDDVSEILNYPIPTYYPKDAGPYITSGVVIVKDKDYGINASIHRILIKENGDLVIRMVEQRHLHYIYNKNIVNGDVDVVIAVGLHPAILLSGSTSGDLTFDELKFASALMGKPLKVMECDTVDLVVPPADYIIEGKITNEMDDEGPFVDITGTYDKVRKQPVIKITNLKRKKDGIFHALLPGGLEHKILMGLPQEPRLYRGIRNTVPSVKNVVLTEGGCCWLHAVVSIDKKTEGDGKNTIISALASHPSLKHVVVVDDDIDINNPNDVEYAIATRVQGDKDLVIIKGAKGSSLDPSSDLENKLTTKVGIDATMPLKGKDKFLRAEVDLEELDKSNIK